MEVGWYSYYHLVNVCDNLTNGCYTNALQQIELWQIRGSIPAAVAATQIILYEIVKESNRMSCDNSSNYLDKTRHEISLLSMAFIRSLNLLVDQGQTMLYAKSISVIARDLGIPENLIQLRHSCCHGDLPDYHIINQAVKYLLKLLICKYWIPQSDIIKSTTSLESTYNIIKSLIQGQTAINGYNNDRLISIIVLDLLISPDNFVTDKIRWINEIIDKRGFNFALNIYSRAVAMLLNFDNWKDKEDNICDFSWKSLAQRLRLYSQKFGLGMNDVNLNSITYGFSLDPLLRLLYISGDYINLSGYYYNSLNIMCEYIPDRFIECVKGLMDYYSRIIHSGNSDSTEIRIIWGYWMDFLSLVRLNIKNSIDWHRVDVLVEAAGRVILPEGCTNSVKYRNFEVNMDKDGVKCSKHLLYVGTYFCGHTWHVVSDEPDPSDVFVNIINIED